MPCWVGRSLGHPTGVLLSCIDSGEEGESCPSPCGGCQVRCSNMLGDNQVLRGPWCWL